MRRRIVIFFSVLISLVIISGISLFILYNSEWAKKKSERSWYDSWFTASSNSRLDKENRYIATWFFDEFDFYEVSVDVKDIDGSIELSVYNLGSKDSDSPQDFFEMTQRYPKVKSVIISEPGMYRLGIKKGTNLDVESVRRYSE